MDRYLQRTTLLVGENAQVEINRVRIILFGVGGVGSWCAEALVRSGVRHLTIVDFDTVSESNVNRQLMATPCTVGEVKVEALRRRLQEISPEASIVACRELYSAQTAESFSLDGYDSII